MEEVQLKEKQIAMCNRYKAQFVEAPFMSKVGISPNFDRTEGPIHGLRHWPEGDMSGWYIWKGEYSEDPNFFQPFHVKHVIDLKEGEKILTYVGLPPGWRFLIGDEGYEDVWEDKSLNDWRLMGQEKYLFGKKLVWKLWKKPRIDWDHDHCAFCQTKFVEENEKHTFEEEVMTQGYTTEDNYHWICGQCYEDFKGKFKWEII